MKNKIILLMSFIFIFVVIAGCDNKNVSISTSEAETEEIEVEAELIEVETEQLKMEETEEVQEGYKNKVVSNPDGIDFEELPDDIKGMIVPIDSLFLYHIENDAEYVPDDPEMFWMVMHYAIGNFGTLYNRAELREYELAVEGKVISEFASAIDMDLEEIPAIPDSLSTNIRYDNEEDLYFFGVGDRGLSQTEILSYEYVDNNTLKINARLFAMDDDSTIIKGDFVFVRNDDVADVMEPLFYFTVSEVVFVEE